MRSKYCKGCSQMKSNIKFFSRASYASEPKCLVKKSSAERSALGGPCMYGRYSVSSV